MISNHGTDFNKTNETENLQVNQHTIINKALKNEKCYLPSNCCMVITVLNVVAIFCFLLFIILLIYVLVKFHMKKRRKSKIVRKRKMLNINTLVLYATNTGVYLRKLKADCHTPQSNLRRIRKCSINKSPDYSVSLCDVLIQNYIF